MKPPPFLYARPESLDVATEILAEYGDEAKILAGGQSLLPLLNFRLSRPSVLVDLGLIDTLTAIDREGDSLIVGSMVRQRTLETTSSAQEACPLLGKALPHVGHVQIRNRGTIGGSLAHADPAAELPVVAAVLDADICAVSSRGTRWIPSGDFFQGPLTTALDPDEIVTSVRFPVTGAARTSFVEVTRRGGDFAIAGVAAVASSVPKRVALAALGVAPTPIRLSKAEAVLDSEDLMPEAIREASAVAAREAEPTSDVHADADYRRDAIFALVRRALTEASA
jgi:aerobic carbon-monoxide dehydrogenase medium subunit